MSQFQKQYHIVVLICVGDISVTSRLERGRVERVRAYATFLFYVAVVGIVSRRDHVLRVVVMGEPGSTAAVYAYFSEIPSSLALSYKMSSCCRQKGFLVRKHKKAESIRDSSF